MKNSIGIAILVLGLLILWWNSEKRKSYWKKTAIEAFGGFIEGLGLCLLIL